MAKPYESAVFLRRDKCLEEITSNAELKAKTLANLDIAGSGGGVATVTGTAPINSSGGDNPVISITAATGSNSGSMSASDKTKLDSLNLSDAVSNESYSGTWDGVTDLAPSKNAVYDKIEMVGTNLSGLVSDAVYGVGWDGVTNVTPSKNAVYDKIEKMDTGVIYVKNYLAVGELADGVFDNTTAIDAAGTAAKTQGKRIHFGPGQWVYNGTGLQQTTFINGTGPSKNHLYITGDGPGISTIILGATSYLARLDDTLLIQDLLISGISTRGGRGIYRHDYDTATNTPNGPYAFRVVTNCDFVDYTEVAIIDTKYDQARWWITHNIFAAAISSSTSMGVALGGENNNSEISDSTFANNRVHIKLLHAPDTEIKNNSFFYRPDPPALTARVAIWLLPRVSPAQTHYGLSILHNKFGNENQRVDDYNILVADEAAGGTYLGDKWPNFTTESLGHVKGFLIDNCRIHKDPTNVNFRPLIYSTTANLTGEIRTNQWMGQNPTYMVEYNPVPDATKPNEIRYWSQQQIVGAPGIPPVPLSNDSSAQLAIPGRDGWNNSTANRVYDYMGGNDPMNRTLLLSDAVMAPGTWTDNGAVTDALGGTAAKDWTGNGQQFITTPNFTIIDKVPMFVEFDIKGTSGTPKTVVTLRLLDNSVSDRLHWIRSIPITTDWRHFRFAIGPVRTNTDTFKFQFTDIFASAVAGGVSIGRVMVYQAFEPQVMAPGNTIRGNNAGTKGPVLDLTTAQVNTMLGTAALSVDVQAFTSSGTWTKPANARAVFITCIAGGGGGGSGRRGAAGTVRGGGTAGTAGAYVEQWVAASSLGATETVTVGTGGAGGAAQTVDSTDGNDGSNGGRSSFGASATLFNASNGSGGNKGTASAGALVRGIASMRPAVDSAAASITAIPGSPLASFSGVGGAGGALTAANTNFAGGNSNVQMNPFATTNNSGVAGGAADGGNGTNGANTTANTPFYGSSGGGGGAGNTAGTVAGGSGGTTGLYGSGGAAGGGSTNSANSGAGAAGAAGIVYVYTLVQ